MLHRTEKLQHINSIAHEGKILLFGTDAFGNESIAVIRTCLCTAQCHRILKLSRTIVDLAGSDEIQSTHLAEVLHASQSPEDHDGVIRA